MVCLVCRRFTFILSLLAYECEPFSLRNIYTRRAWHIACNVSTMPVAIDVYSCPNMRLEMPTCIQI